MTDAPITVLMWPAGAALQALCVTKDVVVIGITTADTTDRTAARTQVRSAIIDVVSALIDCDPALLHLTNTPGQAPTLTGAANAMHIGVSIAHEAGMSVAAINLHGRIGIDIVQMVSIIAATSDWPQMAQDYLGPAAAARISSTETAERARRFAAEWTAQEARLKCVGHGLVEWNAAPASIAQLQVRPLDLPPQWIGALAI